MVGVIAIMGRKRVIMSPLLERLFVQIGENIRAARLRRRFSADIVAQRSGITRSTLRAIERGEGSVSMGAYATVLNSLGLQKDLELLARDDELGRKLQDAGLPTRARAPKIKRNKSAVAEESTAQKAKSKKSVQKRTGQAGKRRDE